MTTLILSSSGETEEAEEAYPLILGKGTILKMLKSFISLFVFFCSHNNSHSDRSFDKFCVFLKCGINLQ